LMAVPDLARVVLAMAALLPVGAQLLLLPWLVGVSLLLCLAAGLMPGNPLGVLGLLMMAPEIRSQRRGWTSFQHNPLGAKPAIVTGLRPRNSPISTRS